MIWYLIFCSSVSGGSVCNTTILHSKEACQIVSREMLKKAKINGYGRATAKCIGFPKPAE